ncbi:YveK family protein [Paenibacillus sp. GCM10027629]|uniref:YveK family protein n=1 Tax=Paenibacillus sp. GCM10027629 TaxID=3273414 RepID=UPI00363CBF33
MSIIELLSLLRILYLRKWILIGVTALATTVIGTFLFVNDQPVYRSSMKLILNSSDGTSEMTIEKMNLHISLMNTFKELLKTPSVLGAVLDRNPDWELATTALAEQVSVSTSEQAPVLTITVRNSNRERSADILHELSNELKHQVSVLYRMNNITILDDPKEQKFFNPEIESNATRNTLIAGFAIFMIMMFTITAKELLSNKVKTEKQLVELGLTPLVTLHKYKRSDLNNPKKTRNKQAGEKNVTATV